MVQYLSFSVWLMSLSVTPSKFIHVATTGKISILFMVEWDSIIYIHIYIYYIFIYSSVDGHLGCFLSLVIVNNAAMNFEAHASFQINGFFFFIYIPKNGIAGSYDSSIFIFWETFILFPQWLHQLLIHTYSEGGFPFFHILTNICYLYSFWW